MIEILAAIPSIIYGMWGMFVFGPFMARQVQPLLQGSLGFLPLFQGPPMGLGMLTAGIILAFMILPFICAITRDVFLLVPNTLRESALALGAPRWKVTLTVVFRAAKGGLITGVLLAVARVSDFTAFFFVGQVVEFGATQQIFTSPANKQTEQYITGRFG